MFKVIGLFWILTCMYGNSFLKLNIIKGINPFYLLMGMCILKAIYIIYTKKYDGRDKNWRIFRNIFWAFIIYSLIIVVVSFFNYTSLFNIEGFGFDRSFIIRQAYFIFASAIGIVIFDLINKDDVIEMLSLKTIISIFMFLSISKMIGISDIIPFKAFILVISSFIYFNKNSKLGLITILIAILLSGFEQSTYIICYLMLIISLINSTTIIKFLKKYLGIIIYFSIVIIIAALYLFYDEIIDILYKDPNAIWRWQYWMNEVRILVKMKFLGVGFGTAYASNSIFSEIYNPHAFLVPDDAFGYSLEQVLFLTAQHSSILNMFYRLGIVGGSLFIAMNYFSVKWYLRLKLKLDPNKQRILKWSFVNFLISLVIISLNPGIESPRFFISYLIMFSINISFLYKYSKLTNISK